MIVLVKTGFNGYNKGSIHILRDMKQGYFEALNKWKGSKMELRRNIYQKLIDWKKEDTGHVLEVKGARQVGKTYILKKFGKENFQNMV